MKALIDGKEIKVRVIDKNYDVDKVECLMLDGNFRGYGVIVDKKDLIEDKKPTMKDVTFRKCEDWDILDGYRTFWRADIDGETISTMCKTKKECMDEVRRYLRKGGNK